MNWIWNVFWTRTGEWEFNSLRPRLDRRPFTDDIFKCIFLSENEWILPRISLKFVPKIRINNIPALVQIIGWRRPGDKPLSEPMMVSLLTHICVTRPPCTPMVLAHPLHLIRSRAETFGLDDVFPHDYLGSGPWIQFVITNILCIIDTF